MKAEPVELVGGLDVRCQIRRSQGGSTAGVALPFTEVGKTTRRRFEREVRSSTGHAGFEIPVGPLSGGGKMQTDLQVWRSGESRDTLGQGLVEGLKNPHKGSWTCLRTPGQGVTFPSGFLLSPYSFKTFSPSTV